MSGNLFTDVHVVKERMFHRETCTEDLDNLRRQVLSDIETGAVPERLHYLMFKMTDQCNSNCEYCAYATRYHTPRSQIPTELVLQTIHEAAMLGVSAISINGGEPLIRQDLCQIVSTTIECGVVPVLMTNGLLLPQKWKELGKAGLKYVIISFDSIHQEVYEKQRGVPFELAMAGLDSALHMKEFFQDMEIHVSAVLTKDNVDDYVELVQYMSDRGIKIHISPYHNYMEFAEDVSIVERLKIEELTSQLLDMKRSGVLIASSTGFIRHLPSFFCDGKKVPDSYNCKIGYTNLFVDTEGNVRPCWSDSLGVLGKLGEASLKEMWHSDKMHNFRRQMLTCQCEGCWYMCTGEVTMMLDRILDTYDD